jgi:nucleoside-diphosphate-sugar epimerase
MKGKVLVTGHQGFIGALLVPMLLKAGYNVVGLDTIFFGQDCEFFKPEFDGIQTLRKDIRLICDEDLESVDYICHLAALSNDPMGELDAKLTYDINYEASVTLAKLAKKAGVKRYIYSSSCSLYGVAGGGRALTENDAFEPMTAYAKSKVLTEQAVLPLSDKNFAVTFLRNATAYGISAKLRVDLVVNNLAAWALTTGQIKIMSDGTPWRPLIHAEDIARAFLAVIEAPVESINGQAFNVGVNTENYQIKDIAALVSQVVPNCQVIITGEHGSDSRSYRVDFSKIQRQLPNFKPRWGLKEAIEDIVESYRKNQMDNDKFQGKSFVRLKQLRFLMEQNQVDPKLYWKGPSLC